MSKGVVIFAFNNEQIDYLAMAAWSARNIHRHLDLPVCVITDVDDVTRTKDFDQVVLTESPAVQQQRYFYDFKNSAAWHNMNRSSIYDLSPWEHTLVLDADYVVASTQLQTLFDIDQDFLAHRTAIDASGYPPFRENNYYGSYRIPMHWATIMCFRRNKTAKLIFDAMQMIRDNWDHYRQLYYISENIFRNDYALSIAMNIVDGHTLSTPPIPWPLMSLTSQSKITQLDKDTYRIDYENSETEGKPRWIVLKQQDFHAMGKKSLGAIVASPC
jgi:hypothetical protein